MTKQDIQKRVLQNGKPLDLDKFSWDEITRTFSTKENNLVLDFGGINEVNFITGYFCKFNTGSDCTFKTGFYCTFNTGSNCSFKTEGDCTFKTGSDCTFETWHSCTFITGSNCTFETWSNCTFDTGSLCTFNTGENCVVVRRDVFEFFEIPAGKTIKLNDYGIKGYKELIS